MSTLRLKSVATSCCAVAAGVLWVSTSFAQETVQPQPAQTTQPTQQQQQQQTTTTTTTQPAAADPTAPASGTAPAPGQPPIATPPPATQTAQAPATTTQQSTTTTTSAPYATTSPASDRYTEREIAHRPNRVLLSTGTGLFILSYGGSVIGGAVSDRDEDKRLFIPVVGPWLDLGQRDCGAATPCGSNEDLAKAMIVTSGVVQGAGILMALGSFFIPETTSVTERTQTSKTKPTVKVLPVSFAAGAGVGAVGRF